MSLRTVALVLVQGSAPGVPVVGQMVDLKDGAFTYRGMTNLDGFTSTVLNAVPYVEVLVEASARYAEWHETVTLTDPPLHVRIEAPQGPLGNITLHLDNALVPLAPPVPIIGISGRFFTANGQPWRYVGCSDFASFPRFANGLDISAASRQRADLGFNTVRTFLYAAPTNPFGFDPRRVTAQMLADYFGVMQGYGLKVDATKGDAQLVLPSQADQIAFQQMVDAVIGNHFNQTCNEPFKNGIDVGVVIPQAGLRSSGDYADATVHQHALDFIDFHSTRDGDDTLAPKWIRDEWEVVLDGFESAEAPNGHYDALTIPFVVGEPKGFGLAAGRSQSPRLAFLLGSKIGRWVAGGTYHSDQGINGQVFTDVQLQCAQEFVRGMNLAPLV